MGLVSWLNDVLYDGLPYAIAVMSFLITLGYLRFPDLTGAGSFVLGGAVSTIATVRYGVNPYLALLLAGASGVLAGTITAFFSIVLKIERLLSGILAAFLLYAVNLLMLHPTLSYGANRTILSWAESLDRDIGAAGMAWHPYAILVFGMVVFFMKSVLDWYLNSEVGLALRALEDVDAGDEVLKRIGLSPDAYRCAGLAIANMLIGLSGAVVSMRNSAADVHNGFDAVVTGMIGFLIGSELLQLVPTRGATILGRPFRIEPTTALIFGTLTYFGLIDLSLRLNVDPQFPRMVLVFLVAFLVGNGAFITKILKTRRAVKRPPTTAVEPVLSLNNISFRYPASDRPCLRSVSMDIASGELIILNGANGSGKSTLMMIAAGVLELLSGQIRFKGSDVSHDEKARLVNIVYVDQNPHRGVVDTLTVEENLLLAQIGCKPSLWRRAITTNKTKMIDALLSQAQFPRMLATQRSDRLSGGQRQITNLLTLLARQARPAVVLLDEPTNNLDADHYERCMSIIEALRRENVGIVLACHGKPEGLNPSRIVTLGRKKKN
jgi:putative tryptophan/tyrosine transport system permease protein